MTWKTILALGLILAPIAQASEPSTEAVEFNPFAPNAEQMLEEFDAVYENETGESPFLNDNMNDLLFNATTGSSCRRETCRVFIDVDKASQTARLYLDGRLTDQWAVSTGLPQFETPFLDQHPNGRIYNKYSSRKFPGGDYNGLGNMPYAIFIRGGFALHGTPKSNWSRLGRKASHGCIRMHPDNAAYFNKLVRNVGIKQTWITVR